MPLKVDTFQPQKRTLGELLSSTSPPIRVPDYQRDYSWDKKQITEFWADLAAFAGTDPKIKPAGEYFLGATVLVNNGQHHLVLDGQQRLATATILLAALRDKIQDYKDDAAKQIHDHYRTTVRIVLSGSPTAQLRRNSGTIRVTGSGISDGRFPR